MDGHSLFLLYLIGFSSAALLCFISLLRTNRIQDPDTREGLRGVLVLSGGWATAQVGYLVVPWSTGKLSFYYLGLIIGIAAVGAWLYFCSAYSGRKLHRMSAIQWLVGGIISIIIVVKLTNPLHELYFQAELVSSPFSHLAIHHGMIHWVSMGIAYALALVGYFLLFELFWTVEKDTRPLFALVAITGLPLVFDVFGMLSPSLLNMTYSPLGVGVFAVGLLFVYLEDFQTIKLAGEHDAPIIFTNSDGRIRDYNSEAQRLFPTIETGEGLDVVVPELQRHLDADWNVIKVTADAGTNYYQISTNPFSAGKDNASRAIILTDITEREQYRRELERQNRRLEKFASIVSHDLRNPLNVASLQVDSAQQRLDGTDESLAKASNSLDRMEELIERLLTLAKKGGSVEEPEPVLLSDVVENAWAVIDTKNATLTVHDDLTIMADEDRLQQLLENLFRNAIDHGREAVSITVGSLAQDAGFYVADDGPGIPEDERASVFEFGYTSTADGTGFGLAIVQEIVAAHGWTIESTDTESGGARFEITDVETAWDAEIA